MIQRNRRKNWSRGTAAVALFMALTQPGCRKADRGEGSGDGGKVSIQSKGSDTMLNLGIAWSEEYRKVAPHVDVAVAGGGSGQGIAALSKGTIDVANCSRNMKPEEIEMTRKNTGKAPHEFVVGYDALAVYVHRENPLNEITFEQLATIYAEGGRFTRWPELGVNVPGCNGDIVRVSRQSSSGTYEFFREHVLSNKDFKLGSRDMNGSKEVVELVANTPCAIGYSGMGYNVPGVKMLKVAARPDQPAVAPSLENTLNKSYPISRPLLVYTLGEPQGELKKYIDWCLSDAGQKVVEDSGYVPLPPAARTQ
jgi:phosphate transport system substrate-binding protein